MYRFLIGHSPNWVAGINFSYNCGTLLLSAFCICRIRPLTSYVACTPIRPIDQYLKIKELTNAIKCYAVKIFELPQEVKDSISMINSPHFLGYSRPGAEITKGKIDYREQFDFATPFECQYSTGKPEYTKLWGSPQVRLP